MPARPRPVYLTPHRSTSVLFLSLLSNHFYFFFLFYTCIYIYIYIIHTRISYFRYKNTYTEELINVAVYTYVPLPPRNRSYFPQNQPATEWKLSLAIIVEVKKGGELRKERDYTRLHIGWISRCAGRREREKDFFFLKGGSRVSGMSKWQNERTWVRISSG